MSPTFLPDFPAVRITLRGGYEIYFDDGHLGGLDQLFGLDEVPNYYKPTFAPNDWWEPDLKKRRNSYPEQ